jgi:hypothetical protein
VLLNLLLVVSTDGPGVERDDEPVEACLIKELKALGMLEILLANDRSKLVKVNDIPALLLYPLASNGFGKQRRGLVHPTRSERSIDLAIPRMGGLRAHFERDEEHAVVCEGG